MTNAPNPRMGILDRWYELDQRIKIALMALVLLVLCIVAALILFSLFRSGSRPDATASPPATGTSEATDASTTSPTSTPEPTDTPAPTPEPTDTEEPSPAAQPDPQGDVEANADGAPVDEVPAGIDIRTASVGADMSIVLQPEEGIPPELEGWADPDQEALLWITLYEPIPVTPTERLEWVFVLDVDGDVDTGRPATEDQPRIKTGLGDEVAISLYYDVENQRYATYCLVWNGGWGSGPQVRYQIDDSRTVIGLALPYDELVETLGGTIDPDAVRGRAAALSGTKPNRIADFYPEVE